MAPSIQMLPTDTAKLLGSSAIIASPYSVAKELVDNAIDAEATCIEITLAPDTISKIQVRDNGFGIGEDDFDALGRRSHTSKLRSFDELIYKGGNTMGFRGEALASLATVGAVTVVTRTNAAPVASVLEITPKTGGVLSKTHRSEPVGTTVILSGLFDELPVRKQVAKKAGHLAKTHIKKLLHQCALSRPHIRLSLRMLGDSKFAWSYTPTKTPSVRDAVLQTFGQKLVSQCVHSTHVEADHEHDGDSEPRRATESAIVLQAFWPTREADPKLISGYGSFISVDSRPVSASRGVMKKINETFRRHLSAALGSRGPVSMPFMQLSIRCPLGSYDPNVDALKEELIFTDNKRLLSVFGAFCQEMYPPAATTTEADAYDFQPITRASTAWSQRPYGPNVENSSHDMPADQVPCRPASSIPEEHGKGVHHTRIGSCNGNSASQDSTGPARDVGIQNNVEHMQSGQDHTPDGVPVKAQVRSRYITDMARTRILSNGEDTHAQDMDIILAETLTDILREQGNEPRDWPEHQDTPPSSSGLFVDEPALQPIDGSRWTRSEKVADAPRSTQTQGMVEANSLPGTMSPTRNTIIEVNLPSTSFAADNINAERTRRGQAQPHLGLFSDGCAGGTRRPDAVTSVDLQTRHAFPGHDASREVVGNSSTMRTSRSTRPRKQQRNPRQSNRQRGIQGVNGIFSTRTSQLAGRARKQKQKPSVLNNIRDDALDEMRLQRSGFGQMYASSGEQHRMGPSDNQSDDSDTFDDSDGSEIGPQRPPADKLKQTTLSMGVTKLNVASAGSKGKNKARANYLFTMDGAEPRRERSLSFGALSDAEDFGSLGRTPLGEETNRYVSMIRADVASLERAVHQSQDLYASTARFVWGQDLLDDTIKAGLDGVPQGWGEKGGCN